MEGIIFFSASNASMLKTPICHCGAQLRVKMRDSKDSVPNETACLKIEEEMKEEVYMWWFKLANTLNKTKCDIVLH